MEHGGSGALERLAAALADRYRIERELGAGGMATVYLAHDVRHQRQVAVKVLRPELAAVIGADRFLTEIRTTANLQHPHILPLFDSGRVQSPESTLYYVMPYVEGITLRDRLSREKQLPIADAIRIASEVASALDYAHRHGVIHRDIKPENVLLHDGSALVADFGIALAVSSAGGSTRMTETGMSLGTPHYMSPEQAMGEREIDARSDVYALGAVLYEMLTGEPPFTGPTAQAIVAKVMTAEPADVVTLRKTVPLHVADAVHTALQKLPADRFHTARGFIDALGGQQREGAATRRSRGPAERRNRRLVGAGLAALLAVGLIGAIVVGSAAFGGGWEAAARPVRLLVQFPASEALVPSVFPAVAAPPDGSGILYIAPGETIGTQLWFRRWDRLQAQRLSQPHDEACCVAFSPSGDSIAYLSPPSQLHVMPLTGGVPSAIPTSRITSVSDWGGGLDWADDGWLYASGPEGLVRVHPREHTREVVARLDSTRGDALFLWPDVLPGSRGAIVSVVNRATPGDPGAALIGIADLESGRVETVLQGVRAIYAPTGHMIVVRADGVLTAVAMDPRTLRTSGAARELGDTVAVRVGNAGPGIVDIALSGDGTLTYIAGAREEWFPVWVDRSGQWRALGDSANEQVFDGLALSPDAKTLLMAAGGGDRTLDLWLKPTDGGRNVRLTFEGVVNFRPRWRPGTDNVSFLAELSHAGAPGMWLVERNAGGAGGVRRVPTGDDRRIGSHAWSPDGAWLVVRTDDQESGRGDIVGLRPGIDTVARPLVATPAEELGAAISPDGRWLAYSSSESGRREVYVRPFPDTDAARHQVSSAGGISPVWNPAGGELFYIDAALDLNAVPVGPGQQFSAGTPRKLFSIADYFLNPYHPQFDVTPDGERFVMARRAAGRELGTVVVFNFLDELEERMAAP